MKKSRFTDQQIAFALRQAEHGTAVEEICRKLGISSQTFYRWRRKYGGLTESDASRLKRLERENARLKMLVAERDLELEVLREITRKKT